MFNPLLHWPKMLDRQKYFNFSKTHCWQSMKPLQLLGQLCPDHLPWREMSSWWVSSIHGWALLKLNWRYQASFLSYGFSHQLPWCVLTSTAWQAVFWGRAEVFPAHHHVMGMQSSALFWPYNNQLSDPRRTNWQSNLCLLKEVTLLLLQALIWN